MIKTAKEIRYPGSGGEHEARKTKNAMGGCVKGILKEWDENGEQQQKLEFGDC